MTERADAQPSEPDPTAEIVELPPSASKLDRALVERAVSQIRGILHKTVARGLEEVGQYLLREFYGDDPELYYSSRAKHTSLATLVDRCETLDFPVSRQFLVNALRVAAVSKALPRAAVFRRLPSSHKLELVRLREPETLERFASRALQRKLSVLKLRALVRKETDRKKGASNRGRPRTPQVVRAVEACLRVLKNEETGRLSFSRSDIAELNDAQRARVDTALESLEKRVAELRRLVG